VRVTHSAALKWGPSDATVPEDALATSGDGSAVHWEQSLQHWMIKTAALFLNRTAGDKDTDRQRMWPGAIELAVAGSRGRDQDFLPDVTYG
jgi:hypothetical protein